MKLKQKLHSALHALRAVPRILHTAFINKEGALRTGWRLAIGIAAYIAAFYAVIYGLGNVFGLLFNAWGLTTSNLTYAPLWAQWVVSLHTSFTYSLAYGVSLAAALLVGRRWSGKTKASGRIILVGLGLGFGVGAVISALSLLLDSMRLEWALDEPVLAWTMILSVLIVLLANLSGEALNKRLILDVVRARFGTGWGVAAACLAALLLSGNLTAPVGAVNTVLMTWIACALYLKGGLWASTLFKTAWTIWRTMIFADPASSYTSIYRFYHVSDAWLTGGNSGMDYGLAATFLWLVILAVMYRRAIAGFVRKAGRLFKKIAEKRREKRREKHAEDSDRNRGNGVEGRGLLRQSAHGNARPSRNHGHRRTKKSSKKRRR